MKKGWVLCIALLLFCVFGTAMAEVTIDENVFPDEAFRQFVSDEFDTDKNGTLSAEEILAVTRIDCKNKGISNVTGCEIFTELTYLDCAINNITAIDVSRNSKLEYLYCYGNNISNLDLSRNAQLGLLECAGNRLAEIDVSQNPELYDLALMDNPITSLDISHNPNLRNVFLYRMHLTTLDVTNCTNLRALVENEERISGERYDYWKGSMGWFCIDPFLTVTAGSVISNATADAPTPIPEPTDETDLPTPSPAEPETTPEPSASPEPDTTAEPAMPSSVTDSTGSYSIGNDGTATFTQPAGSGATVAIPATITVNGQTVRVTAIADKAFQKNGKLTTVTIGKNVKTIGKNAFANCAKLKTVKGGANVVTIKDGAFSGCKALKTFPAMNRLQKIGANAFKGATALAKFTLAKTVTSIGKNAFNGCAGLKTITVKTEKLTNKNVGAGAFKGINRKATFKCPKKQLKNYTTLFVKKGAPKSCKFK